MIERHYSPGELARLLSVDRKTIYNRIQEGDLEAVAFGDRWLVPESAVQRALDRGRRGSAPTRRGPRPAFA